MPESPADRVAGDLSEFIAAEVNHWLGRSSLSGLQWAGDEDDDDPYALLIVKDTAGRRFEVEFDVSVVELTPEELARRDAIVKRLEAMSARTSH